MSFCRKYILPSLLTFTLLLPSCTITSHIGKSIREAGEVHTGVDIFHPVDGKLHQTAAQHTQSDRAYVLAPEVRYRIYSGTIINHGLDKTTPPHPVVCDLQPTGKNCVAYIACKDGKPSHFIYLDEKFPSNTRAYPMAADGDEKIHHRALGKTAPSTQTSLWRRAVALPFDYILDPALSLTLTAGANIGGMVALPFLIICK